MSQSSGLCAVADSNVFHFDILYFPKPYTVHYSNRVRRVEQLSVAV